VSVQEQALQELLFEELCGALVLEHQGLLLDGGQEAPAGLKKVRPARGIREPEPVW
jgi:hypothetical protein